MAIIEHHLPGSDSLEWNGKDSPHPLFCTHYGMLFHDDCLAVLHAMRDGVINTIFADPPFNLGKAYLNGFVDRQNEATYFAWCSQWIEECCRVLAPGGALFIYALPRLAYRFAAQLDTLLEFRHWIALTMKSTYPRGQKLYPAHYALLYFTKGLPRVFNHLRVPIPTCRHCGGDVKDYGGHRDRLHPDGLNLTDFWEDTSPNRHRSTKARPGVNELKPLIPARALQISTQPGDIIFDPFGGGGSTFQEAEHLGRFWLGTEIGDCAPIVQRLSAHKLMMLPDELRHIKQKVFGSGEGVENCGNGIL